MPGRLTPVIVFCLCATVVASVASAQTSSAESTARQTDPSLGFLTSYRFHLNAFGVVSSQEEFVWDADFGGDLDVFDFEHLRGNMLVNYEGIIGEEIRAIDPNQGNYTIDLSVWWRGFFDGSELGVTFHHVSRHLSDRDKQFAIAWNMIGLQYTSALQLGQWNLGVTSRALATVRRSFVDYTGEFGASVQAYRPLHRRFQLMVGGEATLVPVNPRFLGRERQVGGRFELGLRFPGQAGAGEVFVAHERRIDRDPLDIQPTDFTMLGFRFVSH